MRVQVVRSSSGAALTAVTNTDLLSSSLSSPLSSRAARSLLQETEVGGEEKGGVICGAFTRMEVETISLRAFFSDAAFTLEPDVYDISWWFYVPVCATEAETLHHRY